ncbi:hypothetical protein BX616_000214 [Lobosporangium transversale]
MEFHRPNPLLLHEILDRVSYYTASSAWTPISSSNNNNHNYTRSRPSFFFTPRTILACALVSRLWYQIFYPCLWTVYDGEAMLMRKANRTLYLLNHQQQEQRHRAQEKYSNDLARLIFDHSPYIRFFLNDTLTPYNNVAPFQCRRLIDLTLYRTCPQSCQLVQSNPTLKRLTWVGTAPYCGLLPGLEIEEMKGLKQLEEMTLQSWDVAHVRLLIVLRNNRRTLKRLELKGIQGLDTFLINDDKGQQESTNHSSGNDYNNINDTPMLLALERLEELTVDSEWPDNHALMDLFSNPGHCPNLKRLYLSDSLVDDEVQMELLDILMVQREPPMRLDKTKHKAGTAITCCYATIP